jgi:pimeloyl-ACP methyl ester carboxylesterase
MLKFLNRAPQIVGAKNGNRAILVGASLGGCIAIDFSLQYPDLVEKLVLLDPQVKTLNPKP